GRGGGGGGGGGNLGQKGVGWGEPLAEAGGRAETGRAGASAFIPGARLLEFRTLILRPHRAGQGRVFAHERIRALRLRRVDHGPRRLRLFRQFRQQFRYRQQRRGPQSRGAGGG